MRKTGALRSIIIHKMNTHISKKVIYATFDTLSLVKNEVQQQKLIIYKDLFLLPKDSDYLALNALLELERTAKSLAAQLNRIEVSNRTPYPLIKRGLRPLTPPKINISVCS